MPTTPQATQAASSAAIPAEHQLAAAMANGCFGNSSDEASAAGFDKFWRHYPRKEARPAAWAAWLKLNPDAHTCAQIAATLHHANNSALWQGANARFIPLPATWLRGEHWKACYSSVTQSARSNPQSLPEHHPALGTPQTQTRAADPAGAQRHHPRSATTLQRAAQLGQKVLRRLGISVSWAPSCGVTGCVENTSLATGQGAHPCSTARNSQRGAA
jgi:hypothetical protein